jgi:toxin ParE1/3/4
VPAEPGRVGVLEFREVTLKRYRIVYEVVGRTVYVHAVLDGRRDLEDLLVRRLLR